MTARVRRGACPSGKVRHRNRKAALAGRDRALQGADRAGAPRPEQLRVYRCTACAGWHLTHTPTRDPQPREAAS